MTLEELLNETRQSKEVVVELGCGPSKKQGSIGIDALNLPGVDYIANLEDGMPFLPDECVDKIIAIHFLEHIDNLETLLRDIHRVLKADGTAEIIVPHFSNPYYYSDITHKRFFGLYSFDYYSLGDNGYQRKVPKFYYDFHFKVLERKIAFHSPYRIRNFLKSAFKRIFNSNKYMQEIYEECFCYVIPCYEIRFILQKELSPKADN